MSFRRGLRTASLLLALALSPLDAHAAAQPPQSAADKVSAAARAPDGPTALPVQSVEPAPGANTPPTAAPTPPGPETAAQAAQAAPAGPTDSTYDQGTVLSAATGVFGKGAEGLAKVIERAFSKYGRPNAYIAGQEGGGAFIVGLRYGNGTLYHKIEGERPVHWTGPSVGFDVGGDASKAFFLVYNLNDTQDLYRRFPAGEGKVYFVGGFAMSYQRRGDIVLVPIRLGVGWRLGVNAGYYHFTEERTYNPF